MNVNDNNNNYTYETFITNLKKSIDKKEIDGKEFKDGKLSTSWTGWLKAKITNVYYRITNQNDKIASLENDKIRKIFNRATSYFLDKSEKSLVMYQYNHNPNINAIKTKIFILTDSDINLSNKEKIHRIKDFILLLNTFESKLKDLSKDIKSKTSNLEKKKLNLKNNFNDRALLEEISHLDFELDSLKKIHKSFEEELNTILTQDSNAILSNLKFLHFSIDKVQVKDGPNPIPLPSQEQANRAIGIVSTILEDIDTPDASARIFLTKMIQYLLVGDVNKLQPFPLDEASFTIKGVNDLKNEQTFELNPLKFTIDLQTSIALEDLQKPKKLDTLFTLYNAEKDILVEKVADELAEGEFNDLIIQNFNQKSIDIIHTIKVNTDRERSNLIKGLLTIKLHSAKKLIEQTFIDMHRGGFATLKVNGHVFESNFEGQKKCFLALRQQFIKHIHENNLEVITKKNEDLSKLTGIPSSLDDNLFSSFIDSSPRTEGKERIEMISEVSHINETDLPPGINVKLATDAWRFYLLHVFLFTNQATAGINGNNFNNSKDLALTFQNKIFAKPDKGKLIFTGELKPNRVGAPEIELSPTSFSYTLRELLLVDNLDNSENSSLLPEMKLLPSRYDKKQQRKILKDFTDLPILTSSRTIKIDNFYYSNKENEEKPTFTFFSDIKLGMTAFPLIGKIKKALSENTEKG